MKGMVGGAENCFLSGREGVEEAREVGRVVWDGRSELLLLWAGRRNSVRTEMSLVVSFWMYLVDGGGIFVLFLSALIVQCTSDLKDLEYIL